METTFTVGEALRAAWKALKPQIWILVGLLVGYCLIAFILNAVLMPSYPPDSAGYWLLFILLLALGVWFDLGYLKALFVSLAGEEPQFAVFTEQLPKFFRFFAVQFIVGIIGLIGFVLLVLPGIYLMLRLQFAMACVVEEDAGVGEAIRKSWALTAGGRLLGKLLLVLLVQLGLIIAGIVALGVGVFVTVPLCYLIYCHVFKRLTAPQ
jgi:uncharacterized membrane protein